GFDICTAGNITAFSSKSLSQVTDRMVQLPQTITFPTPNIYPPGTTNISNTATLNPSSANAAANYVGTTYSYKDINLSGNIMTLYPSTYNINSISITSNAQLVVAPDPVTGKYRPIVINVAGNNNTTPIDLEGNGIANPTFN